MERVDRRGDVRRMPRVLLASIALASIGIGCAQTSRFSTEAGESYCGVVTAAAFVRAGIDEKTLMRLTLDVDALQSTPGKIWTTDLAGGERLNATTLRAIPQLASDPLSTLSFGEGRVKNAIAVADLGSTQVLVVLSLLQSGDVEVRLIRDGDPTTRPPGPPTGYAPQIFGVFRLHKEKSDCGLR